MMLVMNRIDQATITGGNEHTHYGREKKTPLAAIKQLSGVNEEMNDGFDGLLKQKRSDIQIQTLRLGEFNESDSLCTIHMSEKH